MVRLPPLGMGSTSLSARREQVWFHLFRSLAVRSWHGGALSFFEARNVYRENQMVQRSEEVRLYSA